MAAVCTCAEPLPYTRPSGQIVCLRESCGGVIEKPAPPPKERP